MPLSRSREGWPRRWCQRRVSCERPKPTQYLRAQTRQYLSVQAQWHLVQQPHWHLEQQPHRHLEQQYQCPGVRQAAKAAAGGVGAATLLTRAVAGAKNVGAGTKRPTTLTLRVPLTELLRGGDVARALLLLLLALTTPSASPLRRATPTTSTTATPASTATAATGTLTPTASSATASAATSASTAATSTSTPATTSTATPTPPAAPTSSATAPASSTRSLAPLALVRAAPTAGGRRRTNRLKTNKVGRSSRGARGQQGGRRTPLKDGGARVTTRGPYSDYALLSR
ncbi:unnamed protein product [Closterium sp. NIES-65]|nr:unnamed protein product [Closterium sp. NIES-65]